MTKEEVMTAIAEVVKPNELYLEKELEANYTPVFIQTFYEQVANFMRFVCDHHKITRIVLSIIKPNFRIIFQPSDIGYSLIGDDIADLTWPSWERRFNTVYFNKFHIAVARIRDKNTVNIFYSYAHYKDYNSRPLSLSPLDKNFYRKYYELSIRGKLIGQFASPNLVKEIKSNQRYLVKVIEVSNRYFEKDVLVWLPAIYVPEGGYVIGKATIKRAYDIHTDGSSLYAYIRVNGEKLHIYKPESRYWHPWNVFDWQKACGVIL